MSTTEVIPPANPENANIVAQRDHIKRLEAALKEKEPLEQELARAKQQLLDIERSKLDEIERVKAEKQDLESRVKALEPLREELGKYASAFENLYKGELEAVPQEHRERIERLASKAQTWADRLEAVRDAKALIPSAPATAGTTTNPSIPGSVSTVPTPPPAPASPKEWGNQSWADIASKGGAATQAPLVQSGSGLVPPSHVK